MDFKVKCERLNPLCHGCLSVDRQVSRIVGEFKVTFFKLRNDWKPMRKEETNELELQLCWECFALLKKLQAFQQRINTAQSLLLQYLQSYYIKDGSTKPSLSPLKRSHINEYNVKINTEDKHYIDNVTQYNDGLNLLEEKTQFNGEENVAKEIFTEHDIVKQETHEIKVEFEANDNDTDYDTKETLTTYIEPKKKSKKKEISLIYNYRKIYGSRVTITKKPKSSYSCKQNSEKFFNHAEIEKVLKKDKRRFYYEKMPYHCSNCGNTYIEELDLLRHQSLFHNNELTFPHKCTACRTTITSQKHLKQHWTLSHTFALKCRLCPNLVVCRGEKDMKAHLRGIHGKLYHCNECGQEFGVLTEFISHYKSAHKSQVKVICGYCESEFTQKKNLITHIQRFHVPSECTVCGRTYSNGRSLFRHNQVAHPELLADDTSKELAYCVECDKQFSSAYKYKRHLQMSVKHTPPKKISVPCPECGKKFSRKTFMKNHYKFAHLKVTKHYCEQCNKYYTNGYGLRKHIETVHQKIPQPRNKICDICGRGFTTNKILINHRRTHTGERPHKCNYCPAAFAQQSAMVSHQKTQHKNITLELAS